MAGYDDIGRIPREAFVISTTLLLALCLVSLCARYYIRIIVQKEFALDDGFLAFGTACLIAAMAVLYINMGNMYLIEALTYAPALFTSQPPDLNRVFEFRKLVTASLILTLVAMMAVKFSFLALFRRLIDRIPSLIKYWWFVVSFNLAVTGYGASVYVVTCPHFSGPKVIACFGGATRHKTIQYALSQLVLDVFGDLLILYIPFQLIWKVKIKVIQKLTLACSLCLTAVVIAFTITRASGLEWKGNLDVLWEVYFQIVAAEVGLILVSMTAFRQLFVSRTARNQRSPAKPPTFWPRSRAAIRKILDLRQWTSSFSEDSNGERRHHSEKIASGSEERLPGIPGGIMIGVQSFPEHQGGASKSSSQSSTYTRIAEMDQATSALAGKSPMPHENGGKMVRSQPMSKRSLGARTLESTENDTIESLIIGLYQDRSQG